MSVADFVLGLRDLFNPKEILADVSHIGAGGRDLIESLWNEKGVLERNAPKPLDRVPTADELSYRN
jgi:hypothetical protein